MIYYPSKKLDELTAEIVKLMPPFDNFFKNQDRIEGYSRKLFEYKAIPIYLERQQKFVELIKNKIERLFNLEERKKIIFSNTDGLKGGVVDHHGILNHPVLIGVNITPHYFRMFDRDKNGDIITFATGNVPINNLFHRRGFMLNGIKVNLFAKEDKNKMVYNFPRYDFQFVKALKDTKQWAKHSTESQEFLLRIQRLIDNIDFSGCKNLGDQFTKINFYLWPLLFEKNIREKISNLISIEYDDIVIDYLVHTLCNDPESFIAKILFDEGFRQKTQDYFEGETGAWDQKRNLGTHFFWGVSPSNLRLRMVLENNKLISEDNNLVVNWDQKSIINALQNKELLPGMFLKFSLILFYMGMKPFAGYGSANYLFNLQNKIIKFLETDYPTEAENIRTIITSNTTSIPVLIKRNKNKEIVDYYAFDIIKDGGLSAKYFTKINSVPVKNFMSMNLLNMYGYAHNLYGKDKKRKFDLTSQDFEPLYRSVL